MSDDKETYHGIVCWFNGVKGIGFLNWDKDGVPQRDMFVHYSDISMEGFKTLYKHQKVSFQIGENLRGDPKAINVKVLHN
jgi:CspA family cold shock protein